MRTLQLSVLVLMVAALLAGCGEPDASGVPEAWTKTPASEKVERIKKMPISQQMKIDGINKLPISQEEKDKAIAEVRASASQAPGTQVR
jgi:predicted small lipoprotein YifL